MQNLISSLNFSFGCGLFLGVGRSLASAAVRRNLHASFSPPYPASSFFLFLKAGGFQPGKEHSVEVFVYLQNFRRNPLYIRSPESWQQDTLSLFPRV